MGRWVLAYLALSYSFYCCARDGGGQRMTRSEAWRAYSIHCEPERSAQLLFQQSTWVKSLSILDSIFVIWSVCINLETRFSWMSSASMVMSRSLKLVAEHQAVHFAKTSQIPMFGSFVRFVANWMEYSSIVWSYAQLCSLPTRLIGYWAFWVRNRGFTNRYLFWSFPAGPRPFS